MVHILSILKQIAQLNFFLALQRQQTNLETMKRETEQFGYNYRWSKDCTEYDFGQFLPVLYDQHWTNSENLEVSRGANTISFPTSKAISEMDITFRRKISLNSNYDQCD